jgi:Zn/Cd-binding protein ZinT
MDADLRKMVEQELKGRAGVRFDFECRKTHDRIVLFSDHKSKFVTVSKSPSDYRAMKNRRRDIRKVLKEFENG